MSAKRVKKNSKLPKDKLLSKFTVFFFDKPIFTALLWLSLIVFGALSYTTFLKREGFPSVDVPYSFINGAYFVNDPAKVDSEVSKPISDVVLKQNSVKLVQTQSQDNFFSIQIQYKDGTDANAVSNQIEQQVKESKMLPKTAQAQFSVLYFGVTGGDVQPVDMAISFYSNDKNTSTEDLVAKAEDFAKQLNDKKIPLVKNVFVKSPFEQVVDPATGQKATVQHNFDRFGIREDGKTEFHNSVLVAATKEKDADVIKLDDNIRGAISELNNSAKFKGYTGEVSATSATEINESLSELQRVLLEGLIAVLVVGSIVIAIRASLITVISMITVVLTTIGLLFVLGYTLNVITLFALILGLALIVDDTIIMVEAIDVARGRVKDRRTAVKEATRKISRAMVAATATASLSFAPLLFVGGILGLFIRAIPVTIISSLIISLLVALVFIPFFARLIILGKKQMGKSGVKEYAAGFEKHLAAFIAQPMMWARDSKKRLFSVGITAILVGLLFIASGIFISKDLIFNIFPPTKDTNGLILSINFPPNASLQQSQKISTQVDEITARELGDNFVHSSYYGSGSAQSANSFIEIIPYTQRHVTSVQLTKQLQDKFDSELKTAKVAVGQSDVGPPASALTIQIDATDRKSAYVAGQSLVDYLNKTELKRVSGKTAHFVNVRISSPNQYIRADGKPVVTVTAGFDGDDTTTLVTLAQNAVNEEYTTEKLAQFGLKEGAIKFDLGQESDNQESFRTLVLAFPVLLIVMFVLLAFQFRSFLQPLLIFMAIPFSIFGVMFGLRVTNNAISFFTMLGFFALIGLSIKNTILLTDYANQARRNGMQAIDAAHAALEERFRPLFATSMTAVVSLIPLAIVSPFWQGLAVVLIFGLLSNTILVVTVFPYYYLGAEYLRLHISTKDFFIWAGITAVLTYIVSAVLSPGVGMLVIPASLFVVIVQNVYRKKFLRAR